jgi:hypothetical protein
MLVWEQERKEGLPWKEGILTSLLLEKDEITGGRTTLGFITHKLATWNLIHLHQHSPP